jgi:hypothetical protein
MISLTRVLSELGLPDAVWLTVLVLDAIELARGSQWIAALRAWPNARQLLRAGLVYATKKLHGLGSMVSYALHRLPSLRRIEPK